MVEPFKQKRVGIIMVLLDGLGDYSNEVTEERKTTLQEASMPTLRALMNCKQAFWGIHDPV